MKKRLAVWLLIPLTAVILTSCADSGADGASRAHTADVLEWRASRLARLKDPAGFLNQTGLYWLKPGTYSFGSSASNDVVFDGDAAANIGTFEVTEGGVSMRVADGVVVESGGQRVQEMNVPADTTGEAVSISHRALAWSVVERVGRYAIRLRDYEHPFVADFGPLPYYDIDADWHVEATLHRYPEPIISVSGTVIEGLDYRPESPGLVEFTVNGERFELEAYTSGDRLFYVFGDQTNRDETYGAGRFLYSSMPGDDGKTVLDFNKAYSPPCAFNDFSTCPVASPRNRLAIRVDAGEKYDEALHYSANY